jgi:general secretion pathway protein D
MCNEHGSDNPMKKILKPLMLLLMPALSGCAPESGIRPSTGHMDDTQTAKSGISVAADIPKPVKTNTYLPPPRPKAKTQTYSVVVNEVPVKEILFALAREGQLNIDIHPAIQGRVTLNAVDQTLPAILERLAKQVDLTYKFEGNVLSISPDYPVLRTYRVDYVNMSRDTSGFIGAAAEISSTGQRASTGSSGTTATTTTSGNGANNSSRTSVTSESQSHFWENLEKNIKDILAETDKEVIISRSGNAAKSGAKAAAQGTAKTPRPADAENDSKTTAQAQVETTQEREEARTEYKTLFAATVISNREAGVISVRGTSKQHEKVQEFLAQVLSSAKRQVLIEATIVEVQLNDAFQVGIDWSRLNNATATGGFIFRQQLGPQTTVSSSGVLGTAANALGAIPTAGFVAGYVNPLSSIGNIAASINLLQQFGKTKVLSSPKLMVLNNQTAILKVVDNLVYFTVQAQQSQGAVGGGILSTVTTTPNTVPVGVVMSVTPQINDTGNVNINVRPTVSRVLRYKADPNPNLSVESLIPEIQVREMESMLQISSGNMAILGGLMQDEVLTNTDAVPGLSRIPGIGKLFTARNNANRKTELVIFLRPTVITNATLESDELQAYKQFLPTPQLQQTISNEPVN